MKIAIGIIILLVVVYFLFFRNQKSGLGFWKKAQRNPRVAYDLLLKSDVWHVDDGINLDSQPSMEEEEWDGPFRLNVPGLGLIKIYGKVGYYQNSQDEIETVL